MVHVRTTATYWKGDSFGDGEFYDKPNTIGCIYSNDLKAKK